MNKFIIDICPLLKGLTSSDCIKLFDKLNAIISTCIADHENYCDYLWSEYGNGERMEIYNHYHAQNNKILYQQREILSGTNENNLTNVLDDMFDIMPVLFEAEDTTRNEIIQSLTNKIDEVIKSCVNDNNRKDMEILYQSLQNATNVINDTYQQMGEEICMAEKMVTSSAAKNYKVHAI